MKKIIKMTIAIVLVVCMAFVTFGYTIDEKMKEKNTLKYYMETESSVNWYKTQHTAERAYDVVYNKIKDDESGSGFGGFTIDFGEYPQDGVSDMSKQPIKWIILEKDNNKALLISSYILDRQPYHNVKKESITWETSSLRNWLNNDFYNSAFNSSEKSRIVPYNLTGDNVFILSESELSAYFNLNKTDYEWGEYYEGLDKKHWLGNPWIAAKVTNYANSKDEKGSALNSRETNRYWARDLKDGTHGHCVYKVPKSLQKWVGEYQMNQGGDKVYEKFTGSSSVVDACGIRPCVWITLDSNARSARDQELEKLGGTIGKNIFGGALDSVLSGSSLLIP